jgi:hypothetical protein
VTQSSEHCGTSHDDIFHVDTGDRRVESSRSTTLFVNAFEAILLLIRMVRLHYAASAWGEKIASRHIALACRENRLPLVDRSLDRAPSSPCASASGTWEGRAVDLEPWSPAGWPVFWSRARIFPLARCAWSPMACNPMKTW